MTSRKPTVSILMPVYNSAEFLPSTLENALSQTLKSIEIVAVDDGSTDNSLPILEKFQRKDPRLRILRNDHNQGINISRIRALREARGEYIISLDSDDKLEPSLAKKLLRKARATGVDVVEFRHTIFNSSNKFTCYIRDKIQFDHIYNNPLDILIMRNMHNGYLTTRFLRRECYLRGIEKLGPRIHSWHSVLREDLVHTVATLSEANSMVSINNAGYFYINHGASATHFLKKDCQQRTRKALESSLFAALLVGEVLMEKNAQLCFELMIKKAIMNDIRNLGEILTPKNLMACLCPYLESITFPFAIDLKAIIREQCPKVWECIQNFYETRNQSGSGE